MSLGWVGAEGLNVIDFQGQQATEEYAYCSKVWPYCVNNPTGKLPLLRRDPPAMLTFLLGTECTFVGVCNLCVQFLPKSVKGCCQESPPASCFQNILEGGSSGSQDEQQSLSASPAAGSSNTITDANAAVCATALAAVSACEVATSGFDNLDATAQASCLCYDTANSYIPSVFDGAWSSCAAYASTADTSDYPAVTSALGLCQSAGDVRNGNNAGVTTDGSSPGSTVGAGMAPATGAAEATGVSSSTVDIAAATSTPEQSSSASPGSASSTSAGSSGAGTVSKSVSVEHLFWK